MSTAAASSVAIAMRLGRRDPMETSTNQALLIGRAESTLAILYGVFGAGCVAGVVVGVVGVAVGGGVEIFDVGGG